MLDIETWNNECRFSSAVINFLQTLLSKEHREKFTSCVDIDHVTIPLLRNEYQNWNPEVKMFRQSVKKWWGISSFSRLIIVKVAARHSIPARKHYPVFNNLFAPLSTGNGKATEEILGIIAAWKWSIWNWLPEKIAQWFLEKRAIIMSTELESRHFQIPSLITLYSSIFSFGTNIGINSECLLMTDFAFALKSTFQK